MDPFSHAMVGGTAAGLACRHLVALRTAVLCGMLAGMAPDMDILIRDAADPMLGLRFHRFFTHALLMAPLLALIVAWPLWRLLRRPVRFGRLYPFCLAGLAMHGPLDAMTNYGTHLFWPLTPRRESWSIISIIDPIFTLTLATLLTLAVRRRSAKFLKIGAVFALCYWGLGLVQREAATGAMREVAASRSHVIERAEVKPSFGNLWVWRGQYLTAGNIYVDAWHISPWRGQVMYAGGSLPLLPEPRTMSPVQAQDFEYFRFFSDGWLAEAPGHSGLIGDARFSMLPQSTAPIWGIRLHPQRPEAHVTFENIRKREPGDVARLWRMILGQPL